MNCPAFPCVLSSGFSSASLSHYLEGSVLRSPLMALLLQGSVAAISSAASLCCLGLNVYCLPAGLMLIFPSTRELTPVRCDRTNRWALPENQQKGTVVCSEGSGRRGVWEHHGSRLRVRSVSKEKQWCSLVEIDDLRNVSPP